ncbi:uncharacterized protein RHO25_002160 [Cercospora beticola]|uniref:Uncharacterized protein n=1 Tax=Cercospora beticola TaxID=122368 RepID=A0ABZ0NDE1_CERBT|nr:hypothetical protein RHO25_002160 [Cercospora beticola]
MDSTLALDCESTYRYYTPSVPLATVAVVLFTVGVGAHTTHMVKTRTWDNAFMVLGGCCQLVGYIARLASAWHPCSKSLFDAQKVLLLFGPSLLMFTITLTHTQYIRAIRAEAFCWVPALQWQRPAYLSCNTIIIVLQAAGAGLIATSLSREDAEVANKVAIAGYMVQVLFSIYLLAEHTWVGFRTKKAAEVSRDDDLTTMASEPSLMSAKDLFQHWSRWGNLITLGIGIAGMGRSMMRLGETKADFMKENEWPSYVFDGY